MMQRNKRFCTSIATVILAIASFSNTSSIVSAFTSRSLPVKFANAKLFNANEENTEKMAIDLLTDENRDTLLRPAVDPSRPILVDAFAPWCGPCKLLDKVLKKAQPRYAGKVDFCRWNVNDKEGTVEIKSHFIEKGFTLSKLPSLIVYRDGVPIAVRPGFANEFQLDDWLEKTLPDVLERTFDENGLKMEPGEVMSAKNHDSVVPLTTGMSMENMDKTPAQGPAKEASMDRRMFSPMDFKSTVMIERLRIIRKTTTESNKMEFPRKEVENSDQDEVPIICDDERKCWELLEETLGWENRTVIPASLGLPSRVLA
ncbi:hypothetical protein ACHAWO_010670 [Cyclotella atomus]|uniref:Thioredoxin domain-containing protein n=1 Tax=Cyclotella atomus TaxID=382360 RepID=A0ABD3PTY8_9STRA